MKYREVLRSGHPSQFIGLNVAASIDVRHNVDDQRNLEARINTQPLR